MYKNTCVYNITFKKQKSHQSLQMSQKYLFQDSISQIQNQRHSTGQITQCLQVVNGIQTNKQTNERTKNLGEWEIVIHLKTLRPNSKCKLLLDLYSTKYYLNVVLKMRIFWILIGNDFILRNFCKFCDIINVLILSLLC